MIDLQVARLYQIHLMCLTGFVIKKKTFFNLSNVRKRNTCQYTTIMTSIYFSDAHDVILTSMRRRFNFMNVVWTLKRRRVSTERSQPTSESEPISKLEYPSVAVLFLNKHFVAFFHKVFPLFSPGIIFILLLMLWLLSFCCWCCLFLLLFFIVVLLLLLSIFFEFQFSFRRSEIILNHRNQRDILVFNNITV